MIRKLSIFVLIIGAQFLMGERGAGALNGESVPNTDGYLELMEEYKGERLKALSGDAEHMLFLPSANSMRFFTVERTQAGSRISGEKDLGTSLLHVVDRKTRREVARIQPNFYPDEINFIPGTTTVLYQEPDSVTQKRRLKIWDTATGSITACPEKDITGIAEIKLISENILVYTRYPEQGSQVFGKMALPGCREIASAPINPADPQDKFDGGSRISVSPDGEMVAYGTRHDVLVVRSANPLEEPKLVAPPSGLRLAHRAVFTDDGKYLVVGSSNTVYDRPETRRYLLFYELPGLRLSRRLDITKIMPPDLSGDFAANSNVVGSEMAISPDGKLLGIGYTETTKTTERAAIVLYDLNKERELTRVFHPTLKKNRKDPFAAKMHKLIFAKDGRYLFSSAQDTRVWKVLSN